MRASVCLVLVATMLGRAAAADAVVSIQAQSEESMYNVTAVVDGAVTAGTVPSGIGTVEATMNRIVDVDNLAARLVSRQIPTMVLLDDIVFSSSLQTWNLRYDIVRGGTDSDLLARVLYLSQSEHPVYTGDHDNACLSRDVSLSECLAALDDHYKPAQQDAAGSDYLTFADDGLVTVSLSDHASDASLQTMQLAIAHSLVVDELAKAETMSDAVFGERQVLKFGVGIVFVMADETRSNVVVFDTFDLVEAGTANLQVTKSTGYSVAKHVSIVVNSVDQYPDINFVTIEYMLMAGYELASNGIDTSINGVDTTPAACAAMQTAVVQAQGALAGQTHAHVGCLRELQLCEVHVTQSLDAANPHAWVKYSIPVPVFAPMPVDLRVDSLLKVVATDDAEQTPVWTAVNFKTTSTPRLICSPATVLSFNALQYAQTTLFESAALLPRVLDSATHTVVQGTSSVTLSDALLTLIIEPGSTTAAAQYFTDNPEQQLWLDDVFMSHARPDYDFLLDNNVAHNTLASVSASGRAELALDLQLLARCPRVVNASVESQCVTTHDFDTQGALSRPGASERYVYELSSTDGGDDAADMAWLVNIFGSTPQGAVVAAQFLQDVRAKISTPAGAKVFFVWPVYAWPGSAPVGLRDKTLISLAWSIGHEPEPVVRRRLLTTAHAGPHKSEPRPPAPRARLNTRPTRRLLKPEQRLRTDTRRRVHTRQWARLQSMNTSLLE